MNDIRTYTELVKYENFTDRFLYLVLQGIVGEDTFGYERYLNQHFYNTKEWRSVRNQVILRDNGCDLGIPGYEIGGQIHVHHLNPITPKDILDRNPMILDPEYLICTSHDTHNAITYGNKRYLDTLAAFVGRRPNDTCPWKG